MNPRNTVSRYCVRLLVAVSLLIPCFAVSASTTPTDASVLVQRAPSINGSVEGDLQFNQGESFNLNSGARIEGILLLPGTPDVRVNKNATVGSTVEGSGASQPAGYKVHINGASFVEAIVNRIDPLPLSPAVSPISPAGTERITLNGPGDVVGDFSLVRDLSLNSGVGLVAVPAGAYGTFSASGGNGFILGSEGSTEPEVYSLERLQLNGDARLQLRGPVIVNLRNGLSTQGILGDESHPEWLLLNVEHGGVNLNSHGRFYGRLKTPNGHVNINSAAKLVGSLEADRLNVNANGVLVGSLSLDPPSNRPPVADPQSLATDEDVELAVFLAGSDPDGDELEFLVLSQPDLGTLVGDAPDLVFIPTANKFGTTRFSFVVSDGLSESESAEIEIVIREINDVPVSIPQTVSTLEDVPVTIELSATDVESSILRFSIQDMPSDGTLDVSQLPTVVYTPNPDSEVDDSFTFVASDGQATSAPATVTIRVTPVNDAPNAQPLSFTVVEDTPTSILLVADDTEGTDLAFELILQPSHGTLQLETPQDPVLDPRFVYTPDANYDKTDFFTFKVFDGELYSDEVR